jgi:hypothetical protein
MGVTNSKGGGLEKGLEPGDKFFCENCYQHSVAEVHECFLECKECCSQIQRYDLVDYDRVSLDAEGRMAGRGSPVKLGKRPAHTVIPKFNGTAGNGKKWNYLKKINDNYSDNGPSRSKQYSITLIEKHSRTSGHKRIALELLDIGWPDKDRGVNIGEVCETPIWKPAHPHGVGSSAATCLHVAAREFDFDSKFTEWIKLCLPGVKGATKYGFRSLKRMKQLLQHSGRKIMNSPDSPSAILQRANLGETIYREIMIDIWESWLNCTRCGNNIENHARPVLAALCHILAEKRNLPINTTYIANRFGVNRSYQNWISKLEGQKINKSI